MEQNGLISQFEQAQSNPGLVTLIKGALPHRSVQRPGLVPVNSLRSPPPTAALKSPLRCSDGADFSIQPCRSQCRKCSPRYVPHCRLSWSPFDTRRAGGGGDAVAWGWRVGERGDRCLSRWEGELDRLLSHFAGLRVNQQAAAGSWRLIQLSEGRVEAEKRKRKSRKEGRKEGKEKEKKEEKTEKKERNKKKQMSPPGSFVLLCFSFLLSFFSSLFCHEK